MRVLRRIHAGCVTEVEIYTAAGPGPAKRRTPRLRFRDAAERAEHRDRIGRQAFVRMIHANYAAGRSLYSTLTFAPENECYYFADAKRARANFARRMRRAFPEARFVIVIGRGRRGSRLHMHMISDGVPEDQIRRFWTEGMVTECEPLRAHCVYDGIDHGPDWTALALYLWRHWTPEQGGHHYYATRNHRPCERETVREVKREFSPERPPAPPRGYALVETYGTPFGYQYYKYIRAPGDGRSTAAGGPPCGSL